MKISFLNTFCSLRKRFFFLIFITTSLILALSAEGVSPSILYLTYTQDPSSSMTVIWQTNKLNEVSKILFKKEKDLEWKESFGKSLKAGRFQVFIHTVILENLDPETIYEFKISSENEIYKFKTLSQNLSKPLKIVVGGDAYQLLSYFRKMNETVAKKNPDFIVLGGDIAYTQNYSTPFKGRDWEIKRWKTFFEEWKKSMITENGCIIPIVPVVGNHDVPKKFKKTKNPSALLYDLFSFPEGNRSYRVLDLAGRVSLILLDSNHCYPIDGIQTAWLEKVLSERKDFAFKFAFYHIGAYPSVYSYKGNTPTLIRANWVPLFEDYHLTASFEHHNHSFKRTYPMKAGKIDQESGIVYLGDGAWGVRPRKIKRNLFFLEKGAAKNCCFLLTIEKNECRVEAFDMKGKIFDSVTFQAK